MIFNQFLGSWNESFPGHHCLEPQHWSWWLTSSDLLHQSCTWHPPPGTSLPDIRLITKYFFTNVFVHLHKSNGTDHVCYVEGSLQGSEVFFSPGGECGHETVECLSEGWYHSVSEVCDSWEKIFEWRFICSKKFKNIFMNDHLKLFCHINMFEFLPNNVVSLLVSSWLLMMFTRDSSMTRKLIMFMIQVEDRWVTPTDVDLVRRRVGHRVTSLKWSQLTPSTQE